MTRQLLATLTTLTIYLTTLGQQSIGFKVNGGLSSISDKLYDSFLERHTNYLMPSGQIGVFYNVPVRTHEVFGIELLFTQMEGKERIVDTLGTAVDPNGNIIRLTSNYTISKHISYLSLPIHYGINVKKFTINIGMQFSVRLMSSAKETIQSNYSFNTNIFLTPNTTNYNIDRLHIKDVDFGETIGIIYHLTNKFAIEGNYYYGLNNIYPNARRTTIWRTQQMTIGLRYTFYTKKPKETTENK